MEVLAFLVWLSGTVPRHRSITTTARRTRTVRYSARLAARWTVTTKPKTDREMMLDPDSWGRWPLLPLKRPRSEEPNCAMIVGDPTKEGTVYLVPGANIWHIDDEFIAKNGSFVPVDDVLAQGWEIDQ